VSIYLKVSTEGAKYRRVVIPLFQSFIVKMIVIQGRRASLRSTLAPGYHISRLWRSLESFANFLNTLNNSRMKCAS
jgi:hypothetical protein